MEYIFESERLGIKRLELPPYGTNAYIVVCTATGESLIVDAPGDAGTIMAELAGTSPKYLVLTHNHVDHIGALEELKSRLSLPVAVHPADSLGLAIVPDVELSGGTLEVGRLEIDVIHTPGHTPGSICLLVDRCLLAGDTIFPGGPGHTVTPEAFRAIIRSIEDKILALPGATGIYPGHGGATDVAEAKREYGVFASRPHPPDLHGDVLWESS